AQQALDRALLRRGLGGVHRRLLILIEPIVDAAGLGAARGRGVVLMRRAWMPPESALMSTCGAPGSSPMLVCCMVNTDTSSRNAVLICWHTRRSEERRVA